MIYFRAKLEQDLCEQKKKVEEVVVVLEECRKERWLCEERNKDLTLKLADTKAGLRDARESLQTMWNGIDERASWLIENQAGICTVVFISLLVIPK